MAEWTVPTGIYGGRLRFIVTQGAQSGNSTSIRVRVIAENIPTATYKYDPVSVWVSGVGNQINGTFTWQGNISSKVLLDWTRTLTHDANGYLSLSVNAGIGATGTGGLGGPTSFGARAVSFTRIPQKPKAPVVTSLRAPSSSSIAVDWSLPDAMGGVISGYRVQYATNSAFTSATTIDTGSTARSRVIGNLPTAGREYFVRVAAWNQAGLGAYSSAQSVVVGIGGSRFDGSKFVDLSTAKRLTPSGWVDLTTAKRLTPSGWVDLS